MMSNNRQGQEFYRSLSRKELQSLCKKYGLPARKSSSEMADSLFSYFQKTDLSLISSCKNMNEMQDVFLPPSSLATLQAQAPLCLTGNALEVNFRSRSCPSEEGDNGNRNITCNDLQSHLGLGAYNKGGVVGSTDYFQGASQSFFVSQCSGSGVIHKEPLSSHSGRVEDKPKCCCGNMNVGLSAKENTTPAMRTYTKVPASFEFYVSSEEGIKLCVDLNSSPSDWIKKYSNQVSLCNIMGNAKSQSLHQEHGCTGESNKQIRSSFPGNVDTGKINDGCVQAGPSQNWNLEKNIVDINLPDGGNRSSTLSPARPSSIVHEKVSDCLKEHKGLSSEVQKQINSNTESCCKNGPTSNLDVRKQIILIAESCTKIGSSATLDSDITDVPTEKTACNFVVSSLSDGSVELIAAERQRSKHDDGVCENSNLQNCSNVENNCAVLPGCVVSCSTELQLSEAGNYIKDSPCLPNKNGKFLDPGYSELNLATVQAALATSSENDHCEGHLPTWSEYRDWSDVANRRESSVCSQVDNPDDMTFLKSENLEYNEEFYKKRSFIDSEGQNSFSKHDAKILRSMKHSIREVLPRRSMRLVSK